MNEQDSTDPKFWKWSTFYYNPQDKNGFVPRRNGLGLAPNYAQKTIYFIFVGIIVITVALVLYNLDILKF